MAGARHVPHFVRSAIVVFLLAHCEKRSKNEMHKEERMHKILPDENGRCSRESGVHERRISNGQLADRVPS